jgi:hypothetical protein
MLAVFTGGAAEYYSHAGQLTAAVGRKATAGALQEVYFPMAEHTYTVAAHRERLVQDVKAWVLERMHD